ncbi:MAG: hypothetical protein ACKPKO_62300, partial [Candidatus Fonsibacter sp.]
MSGGSIFIRSDVIGFGRTAFMTASSDSISAYAPLRAEKRTEGSEWHYVRLLHRPSKSYRFHQTASINQNGDINTLDGIYCEGNLTAPTIYTMTRSTQHWRHKATKTKVDSQLGL